MVTLKDLAERAGVSVSLVSAVLNDNKHVRMSEKTRERVLAEIRKANYVPNHAARSLRLSRTNLLAVIIPEISRPIFEPLLRGIYAGAEEFGYAVLLGDAAQLVSGSQLVERILGQGQVDGTIVRHSATLDQRIITELSRRQAPLLVLDHVDLPGFHWVALDETEGAAVGVRHLIELGHRDIAFLGGVAEFSGTKRRLAGFRQAMTDAGLEVREDWIMFCVQDPEAGYRLAAEFLSRDSLPSAIFVNNIVTARGVVAAAGDLGVRVPDDLSLVAFHDVPFADVERPAITTVAMPMHKLGLEGIRMFERLRQGEKVEPLMITDPAPRLIVRASTRAVNGR
ncbi:LacI family DNA-binding transcriptional regulator [Jiangella rhizosphaerae]|uniref:LacI family transcriptional regulator n=1 Tax=Jiangella rhizosphaerae TaxID=2293569 RepID=A0A418KX92_9ACTN|nr:LacI family DNA-binding transcriptional regulator [Jiangella rhizosphaerae]RIQ37815.1 LacI family transcriptional regulator [Jiangella rhizosphaerae]